MPDREAQPVVVVGHPRVGSRTHRVAWRVGELLTDVLSESRVPTMAQGWIDLAELAPCLLNPLASGPAEVALRTVERAPLLVVASPTFRAAYSGLLKVFLDLLPRYGLVGHVVVPLMTAGIAAHRDTVDTTLRPVLSELGAQLPVRGISVLESELEQVDEVFDLWWGSQGSALRQCLREEVTTC